MRIDTDAQTKDVIAGFLEVGTNEKHEVVINLDKDMTGHIVFSQRQARKLANLLMKMADRAFQESRGREVGGIGR